MKNDEPRKQPHCRSVFVSVQASSQVCVLCYWKFVYSSATGVYKEMNHSQNRQDTPNVKDFHIHIHTLVIKV